MDSKFFEKWFKEMFLNEVEENKAIVMDNATFHCKSRLYELCKNANKFKFNIFTAIFYRFKSNRKVLSITKEKFEKN